LKLDLKKEYLIADHPVCDLAWLEPEDQWISAAEWLMQRVFIFGSEQESSLHNASILWVIIPMAGDVTVSQCNEDINLPSEGVTETGVVS